MKEENDRLRKALHFYADKHHMDNLDFNYDIKWGKCGYEEQQAEGEAYEGVAEDVEDGEVAREALKVVGEETDEVVREIDEMKGRD